MFLKWLPWRFLATRVARAYGFLDPIQLLGRLRQFAQPSEVSEPTELLRAGFLFHARGLVNTKAIQHNLDWIWPYWVEKQFNPADESFIPRAFSFSHINLTHRNWTAVGLPGVPFFPIVDPRGLVTPLYDGWSLDFWVRTSEGSWVLPSQLERVRQELAFDDNLKVRTGFDTRDCSFLSEVTLQMTGTHPECVVRIELSSPARVLLAVIARPYNPEGISFIESIRPLADSLRWRINEEQEIRFARTPDRTAFSNYRQGDVYHFLTSEATARRVECSVGMATGAGLFEMGEGRHALEVRVPIQDELALHRTPEFRSLPTWTEERASLSRLEVPDVFYQELYEQAVASLRLHCSDEVYPGPYTYKRFWFRDAAFILHSLIVLGGDKQARRILNSFSQKQTATGYFLSQTGEWDSNGEALWILQRYLQLTGQSTPETWIPCIRKGARWILRKRLDKDLSAPHAGLLPAGFSAEHLGPNDFYYWDNFWGVAGLQAAARLLDNADPDRSREYLAAAKEYLQTIRQSFRHIPETKHADAISASPYRRMDAGAVGSIVADYPLQLFAPADSHMMRTVEWLLQNSFFKGGFFQNMIHSGINVYLTLQLAQCLLRANDIRALDLMESAAQLASPTGQWPEAIHPQTLGGCMGDGQHIWASAEWIMMMRNLFVREEHDRLILGSGLLPRWIKARKPLRFGPTLCSFGKVHVSFEPQKNNTWRVSLDSRWHTTPPLLEIRMPGMEPQISKSKSQFLVKSQS